MTDKIGANQAFFSSQSASKIGKMQHLRRDGVALAYTETGTGSGTFPMVFIHGWGCDHTIFVSQVDHFKQAHRTIAVDLRGFGESDKPDQDYTMAGYADDIVWLCSQLNVVKPIVIAHSMGGPIALAIAAHYPDFAKALVLLDSAIFAPPELTEHVFVPLIEALHGPDYREAIRREIGGLFSPFDDQAGKARMVEQALNTPQRVALTSFKSQMIDFKTSEIVAACKIPVAYIGGTRVVADLHRFHLECPQLVSSQIMLSGHFFLTLVPEQVNVMIERFLEVNVA